ncbi:MAG: YcfL family protein [Burkholderiales bacterium]|nr:YcfL family protein [Burkholderiales bacterium]
MKLRHLTIRMVLLGMTLASGQVLAQSAPVPETGGVTSKLLLRGDAHGVKVNEMRMVRRSDVLVIQADLYNAESANRQVYYRFRWMDGSGMQVGDGEPWKPLLVMGQQSQLVKGVAPTSAVVDFRLEMNVEKP